MTSPIEPRPRRPFAEEAPPEPFYQTAEFRRAVGLMGLLLLVGVVVFFFMLQHTSDVAEKARAQQNREAAKALMPGHPLSPEEREARHIALLSKLEGALADSENAQPLLQQTPGYWKLLEVVNRYSPEEVAQRSKIDFERDLVMKDPDAWRGEFVRARGVLKAQWAVRLERPVMNRTDVFHSLLTDGEQFFFVDLLDRPAGIEDGDPVDMEGVLYRTVRYEGNTGDVHEEPLIVARSMKRVPAAVESGWRLYLREHTVLLFALLAFLVFGSLLLFSAIRQGRKRTRPAAATSGSFQELFDKKLREAGKVPPPHD
jgi:hypothetical protein